MMAETASSSRFQENHEDEDGRKRKICHPRNRTPEGRERGCKGRSDDRYRRQGNLSPLRSPLRDDNHYMARSRRDDHPSSKRLSYRESGSSGSAYDRDRHRRGAWRKDDDASKPWRSDNENRRRSYRTVKDGDYDRRNRSNAKPFSVRGGNEFRRDENGSRDSRRPRHNHPGSSQRPPNMGSAQDFPSLDKIRLNDTGYPRTDRGRAAGSEGDRVTKWSRIDRSDNEDEEEVNAPQRTSSPAGRERGVSESSWADVMELEDEQKKLEEEERLSRLQSELQWYKRKFGNRTNDNTNTTDPSQKNRNVEYEFDEMTLVRRLKQIEYGKNTTGYQNYVSTIPKNARSPALPKTPNKFIKYSRRKWDSKIRIWRRLLHFYDKPNASGEGGSHNTSFETAPENMSVTSTESFHTVDSGVETMPNSLSQQDDIDICETMDNNDLSGSEDGNQTLQSDEEDCVVMPAPPIQVLSIDSDVDS